jgi:hypothetical protein
LCESNQQSNGNENGSLRKLVENALKECVKFNKEMEKNWDTIQKLKERDVVYTKADKSNEVVVMEKNDYREKIQKLIKSGPFQDHFH